MSSEAYHRGELAIARDPSHPAHILPPPLPSGSRVLDVGCGAGQTLLSAYPDARCVGVDVDLEALTLGTQWAPGVAFIQSAAEALPLADGSFDAVVARVSLAYTDISASLREARRVLKPGGTLWMVLHPASIPLAAARTGGPKAWLFFAYIALNSTLFHFTGRTFRLAGRRETFQTASGMRRALRRAGFRDIQVSRAHHFVITATAV